MPEGSIWAYLLGAGGGVTVLAYLIKGITDWLNGSHAREKRRALSVAERISEAERREQQAHDDETRSRAEGREIARERDYAYGLALGFQIEAATLRAVCIQHGTDPAALPPMTRWRPYSTLTEAEKPPPPKEPRP